MAFFTDLLRQILSRLPAKFLRRFRFVSTHPDNCERLPESMAGFLYTSTSTTTCNDDRLAHRFFDDVSACGHHLPPYFAIVPSTPPFASLPKDQHLQLLDGCNGLLLCRCLYYFPDIRCYDHRYVVCNPATQQSAVLPIRGQSGEVGTVRLCFDAAVSPHFHVFAILLGQQRHITGVEVYSSETNQWVHKDNSVSCCQPMWLSVHRSATVFLNGCLHFCTIGHDDWACRVTAVDTEGETWTSFDRPKDFCDGFIQLSQGKLHYACFAKDDHDEGNDADIRLEVYVMDDYDTKEWTMRHSVKVSDILGGMIRIYNNMRCLGLVAIHPDCSNLIFFTVGWNSSLVRYNIDSRHAKLVTELGRVRLPYVPYVPMYSELQSLQYVINDGLLVPL